MASVNAALKPLRRPRLWLGLWIAAIVALIVVCLIPLPPLPDNSDKLEHLFGYFALSAAAVQLFGSRRALSLAAVCLVALGIGVEIAQGFTAYRSSDLADALANTLGVLLGMATALTPWRDLLLRVEKRLFPQA
jgi:VanZ family protein